MSFLELKAGRSVLLLPVICLILIAAVPADEISIPLQETLTDGVQLDLLRSDAVAIELDLSIGSLKAATVDTKIGPFTRLSFDGCARTDAVGKPSLPLLRTFLVIPEGAECRLDMSVARRQAMSLDRLGLPHRLLPKQPPIKRISGARENAPFIIERGAYAADSLVPEPAARLLEEVTLRGRRLKVLEISPVSYNPLSGTISVVTSAKIRIELRGADMERTARTIERLGSSGFDRLIRSMVKNAAVFEASLAPRGRSTSRGDGYLMIADPALTGNSSLQNLIALRTAQGFDVTLVDTNTTGSSNTAIKSYVENAYNTWPVPPAYLLLIGDTNTIPHWTGSGNSNPSTDLNYACVDGGDYLPDISRGRFPVRSTGDLDNLCSKIIAMNGNTREMAAFMAGNDGWALTESTHDNVIDTYLVPEGWTVDKLYCHTYNATTSQVTQAFNDNRSIGCYSGHGSANSWADGPVFYQSHVRALTNTTYPLILSFACLTGKYTNTECFGETWVRDPCGATSFFGSSELSDWGSDCALETRIFMGCYNHGHGRIGPMIDFGQLELYLDWGGTQGDRRRYYEMYNLMGDPTMEVTEGAGTRIPFPDIRINGVDCSLTLNQGTMVNLTVGLDAGTFEGIAHDWWVWIAGPIGTYWQSPTGWQKSFWPVRASSAPLFSFTDYPLGSSSTLPAGSYFFYFVIDELDNTYEGTYEDTFELTIS